MERERVRSPEEIDEQVGLDSNFRRMLVDSNDYRQSPERVNEPSEPTFNLARMDFEQVASLISALLIKLDADLHDSGSQELTGTEELIGLIQQDLDGLPGWDPDRAKELFDFLSGHKSPRPRELSAVLGGALVRDLPVDDTERQHVLDLWVTLIESEDPEIADTAGSVAVNFINDGAFDKETALYVFARLP